MNVIIPRRRTAAESRRATNVSLPERLVAEARELGVSLSQSCEAGLAAAVVKARGERWLTDNQAALESNDAWVEQHGLPLARHRTF